MKTFFAELAERGPLLIIGQNAYTLGQDNGPDYLAFSKKNKMELIPLGTTKDIIRFYESINTKNIYNEKRKFIEGRLNQGFGTSEDRQQSLNDEKLISFIVKDLFPYMNGRRESVDALLDEAVRKEEKKEEKKVDDKELLKTIKNVKKQLYEEQANKGQAYAEGTTTQQFFSQKIVKSGILTIDDMIYSLESSDPGAADIKIRTGRDKKYFKITQGYCVNRAERELASFMEWKHSVESIEEFSDYIIELQRIKLEAQFDVEKAMKLAQFESDDVGFMKKDGQVYIYHKTRPFAMLDPRPTNKDYCYEFPDLKVAMKIYISDGQLYLEEPHLVDSVWHPFVEYDDTPFQHLCGGHVPRRNGNDVEWVAKALDDAKNLVMNGLTSHSIRDHGGGETNGGNYFGTPLDKKLSPRKITIAEARKKGLQLTNKWEWRD